MLNVFCLNTDSTRSSYKLFFSFMFWWLLSFSFIPKLYYILFSFPLVSHFFFLKEFSWECNLLFPFCFDAFSPFPLHLGSSLKILRQGKCEERKYKLNLIIIENNLGNQFLKKKKMHLKNWLKLFFPLYSNCKKFGKENKKAKVKSKMEKKIRLNLIKFLYF